MSQVQSDIARVEGLALTVNKRLNALEHRLSVLDEMQRLQAALQEAVLELSSAMTALGEAMSQTKGSGSSEK